MRNKHVAMRHSIYLHGTRTSAVVWRGKGARSSFTDYADDILQAEWVYVNRVHYIQTIPKKKHRIRSHVAHIKITHDNFMWEVWGTNQALIIFVFSFVEAGREENTFILLPTENKISNIINLKFLILQPNNVLL